MNAKQPKPTPATRSANATRTATMAALEQFSSRIEAVSYRIEMLKESGAVEKQEFSELQDLERLLESTHKKFAAFASAASAHKQNPAR
jgi:hypothetical protein